MSFRRHAIYYTPPPGPLADFGAAWLAGTSRADAPCRTCRPNSRPFPM
jgi:hypothetical protein